MIDSCNPNHDFNVDKVFQLIQRPIVNIFKLVIFSICMNTVDMFVTTVNKIHL